MTFTVLLVGAYLLGSVPASYLAARWGAGIDLRDKGSKNLGATNVYRVLGWRFAVPVGVFDIGKGLVPVIVARQALEQPWTHVVVGAAAVVGHVFSVFMKFRGGKGVATASGVVLGLAPVALVGAALVWVLVLAVTGYVSLASMIGALTFPAWVLVLSPENTNLLWAGVGIALFILFTHRENVMRLLSGTESRFRRGTKAAEGGA